MKRLRHFVVSLFFLVGCSNQHVVFHLTNSNQSGGPGSSQVQFPTTVIGPVQAFPRVATRFFLASVLRQNFGGGTTYTNQENIINGNISTDVADHGGGPCDPYIPDDCPEVHWDPHPDIREATGGMSQLSMIPLTPTTRFAMLTRACWSLLSLDANDGTDAVSVATTKVLGVSTITTWVAPSSDNIASAYELFYPGRTPSNTVMGDLEMVSGQAANFSAKDAWRYLFLTLCLDPGWQML